MFSSFLAQHISNMTNTASYGYINDLNKMRKNSKSYTSINNKNTRKITISGLLFNLLPQSSV